MTTTELRELDACVEINAFNSQANKVAIKDGRKTVGVEFYDGLRNPIRHYTTDPAAAMDVLKKCLENGCQLEIQKATHSTEEGFIEMYSIVEPHTISPLFAKSEELELCICLFAKKLFTK